MHYLAHRIKETGEEQTLKVHLEETANLAAKFAKSFGYEEWGIIQRRELRCVTKKVVATGFLSIV